MKHLSLNLNTHQYLLLKQSEDLFCGSVNDIFKVFNNELVGTDSIEVYKLFEQNEKFYFDEDNPISIEVNQIAKLPVINLD
jgi:hypothetical protein